MKLSEIWKNQNAAIIGALIGLVGAISNNGFREGTDALVREALLSRDGEEILSRIREEKFAISPSCATCKTPCGNTSDYDTAQFESLPAEILEGKLMVMDALRQMAEEKSALPEVAYQAITYLGYDLQKESYLELLEEMKR